MPVTVEIDGRQFRSIKSGLDFFERDFRLGFQRAARPVRRELLIALKRVAGEMVRRHGTQWSPGGSPQGRLFRRSGGGIRGIARSVKVSGNTLGSTTGQIGAPFPISVHEKGATIRAKNAQFLTIPLPAALDSRGVPLRRRARDWPDTFVRRSRRGNLLIFRQEPDGDITPLYLLRKRVVLPPRLGLEEEFKAGLRFFEAKMLDILDRQLARA
jgi:hypothetical protein